ncbi:MAG: chromosomal replication initiator protein DnaA, partial [Candidatus Binatia bacterium]
DVLREKIGGQNVETWFHPALFLGVKDRSAVLQLPNKFFVDHIADNYHDALLESFRTICGDVSDVRLHSNPSRQGELFLPAEDAAPAAATGRHPANAQPMPAPTVTAIRPTSRFGTLVPKYTFASFVVGASNQFAHAAAQAVANQPGEHYNPLFIYGGVGLGKTHLINAIGHRIVERNNAARVGYVSAETFMNELIAALKRDRMDDFKNRFRKLDILILDDVQFIAGRERTQEEFFHTFNVLHESRRQIVLTSDKTPKDIPHLEDRLRNRFEWGLIADIQAPDIETRIAILQRKAELDRLHLPQEVTVYLASKFESNIRELEGSLTRLAALASLGQKPITIEFAKEALKDLLKDRTLQVTVEVVQKVVCEQFGIRLVDMKSARRTRNLAFARQVAMYLSRKLAAASLPSIGDKFGKRDHSTVFHGIRTIEQRLEDDPGFQTLVAKLERVIGSEVKV